MTTRRITGSQVRTVITESLTHLIDTAPWRPGWPTLNVDVSANASASEDIARLIQFNALMAENHIQSMLDGLEREGSSGPVLAGRSALEAAGRACWLAEPDVDDDERFRRALRSRHAGAAKSLRLLQTFDRAGAGAPSEERRLADRVAELEELAARAGISRSSKGRLLLDEPSDAELIQSALSWLDQPERGRLVQTILSATVHSGADLISRVMLEDINRGPAGRVFAVRLTRAEHLTAAGSAGLGYIHLLKRVAPLFGMDAARSDEMVSSLGGGIYAVQALEDVDWNA